MTANQGDGRPFGHSEPFSAEAPGLLVEPAPADDFPSQDDRPSVASRIVSVVLALIVGVVYGTVGTVAHPLSITIASIVIPWGLVLSLVGVSALLVGFRLVLGERLAVIAAAVGIVGIVALFSLESTGGSVLIQQGVSGLVWVLGPALIAALVIFFPSLPARPRGVSAARPGSDHGEPADRLGTPTQKEFPTP